LTKSRICDSFHIAKQHRLHFPLNTTSTNNVLDSFMLI